MKELKIKKYFEQIYNSLTTFILAVNIIKLKILISPKKFFLNFVIIENVFKELFLNLILFTHQCL